jgi:uncharacterized SAM-binding protein YcdF (DUF218 family)
MVVFLKFFVTPVVFIILFLAFGFFFMWENKKISIRAAIGWFFSGLAFLILVLMSFNPFADILVNTLESQYKPVTQSDIEKADIIVVLGCGIYSQGSYERTAAASGSTYARLFDGVEIFKKSHARKLVVAGLGYGNGNVSEASVMRDLAIKLGVPSDSVIVEDRSNTTSESVLEMRKMGLIDQNSSIGLVTSAIHMPRSVWSFRNALPDTEIIPMPCEFLFERTRVSFLRLIPNVSAFSYSSAVAHELIGIVWYKLRIRK